MKNQLGKKIFYLDDDVDEIFLASNEEVELFASDNFEESAAAAAFTAFAVELAMDKLNGNGSIKFIFDL